MRTNKRYYAWIALFVLLGMLTIFSFAFWNLYRALRDAIQIGHAAMNALAGHNFEQLRNLTDCPLCAKSIQHQWMAMEQRYGRVKHWRFHRAGRVLEFGAVEPTHLGTDAARFEVEYRVSFERQRNTTIAIEVVSTEEGYRLLKVRTVREIYLYPYRSSTESGTFVLVGELSFRDWVLSGLPQYGVELKHYIEENQRFNYREKQGLIGQRVVR